ncbi:hypothetical protein J6R97_01730 [bacterium]|nr:hypothetical protein [bacterium]
MNISLNHANINLKGATQSTLNRSQEIAKNRMKILLTQDIWEKKLDIRLPESQLEFETLMEILCHRVKLDRYARYKNDKLETKGVIELYDKLITTTPESQKCKELKEFLDKKGNLDVFFDKINKHIRYEKKSKRKSLKYFKELIKLEEDYLEKGLITEKEMDDFYKSIKDKNINSEKKYTTKKLIEILESKEEDLKQEYQKLQIEESSNTPQKQNFFRTLRNMFKKENK